MHKDPEGE